MEHHRDRCIALNERCIAIDTAELFRNNRLRSEATLPGMRELYSGYIRENEKQIRISRESIARWEAI